MRNRQPSNCATVRKLHALAVFLLVAMFPLSSIASGGHPPYPGSPALDTKWSPDGVVDDNISPICQGPDCSLSISQIDALGFNDLKFLPCLNGTLGGIASKVTSVLTGMGCKDDRYKNMAIIGPQVLQHPCLTPLTVMGVTTCASNLWELDPSKLTDVDLLALDAVGATNGTQGSMPNVTDNPKGMPHKDTLAMAPVNTYPWLYKETDLSAQFLLYRGTGNNGFRDVDHPISNPQGFEDPSDDSDVQSGNAAQIQTAFFKQAHLWCQLATNSCTGNDDTDNFHYWIRLALDSCTNQYILPTGLNPQIVFNPQYYAHAAQFNEAYCQPLSATQVPCKVDLIKYFSDGKPTNSLGNPDLSCLIDNGEAAEALPPGESTLLGNPPYSGVNAMYDYRAWGYLERAWDDVLATPYSPSSGANHNLLIVGSGKGQISLPTPMTDYTLYGCVSGQSGSKCFNYSDPGTAPVLYTIKGDQNCTGTTTTYGVYSESDFWAILGGGTLGAPTGTGWPPNNFSAKCDSTYAVNKTFSGALTTINQLAMRPYERIFDATHPFTPRWDMWFQKGTTPQTDRTANSLASNTWLDTLEPFVTPSATTNYVPVPGDAAALKAVYRGYIANPLLTPAPAGTGCPIRCASTPVDIMLFRAQEFESCMSCRTTANAICFWNEVAINDYGYYAEANADGLSPYQNCCAPGEVLMQSIQDTIAGESLSYNTLFSLTFLGIHLDPYWWVADIDGGFCVPLFDTGGAPTCSVGDNYRCKTRLVQAPVDQYNQWNNKIGSGFGAEPLYSAGQWPPCATTYEYPFDNAPALCQGCLKAANDYSDDTSKSWPNSAGSVNSSFDKTGSTKNFRLSGVTKCCNDLAQPIAPINILKIRNLQDDPTLKDGSGHLAEGYYYRQYFSDGNLPFMRWWDEGTSAGGAAGDPVTALAGGQSGGGVLGAPLGGFDVNPPWFDPILGTNYQPDCDKGKDDVIVGIGTESTGSGSPSGICRLGGTGDPRSGNPPTKGVGYSCINVGYPDRLTSWEELKQAQMNTMRNFGLDCLPAQEKLWKFGGAEEGPLFQAGRHFSNKNPLTFDTTNSLYQAKSNPWPLRWRGFLTDSRSKIKASNDYLYRFPNYDTGTSSPPPSGSLFTGLDNAQTGDIIYLLPTDKDANVPAGTIAIGGNGTTQKATHAMMPFMAVVTSAQHNGPDRTSGKCDGSTECTDDTLTCSDHITVVDVNNGKYPDACGVTDYVGMGQTRTIYKEWLPPNIQDLLFANDSNNANQTDECNDYHTIQAGSGTSLTYSAEGVCDDPKYSVCTFYDSSSSSSGPGAWSNIHVYRPTLDERGDSSTR
jgi:hypothetical protein